MLRNIYTLVCTLFALLFLTGLSSVSHAQNAPAAVSSISFIGNIASSTGGVALTLNTSLAQNRSLLSLTSSSLHIYNSALAGVTLSSDQAVVTIPATTVAVGSGTGILTGSLSYNGTTWAASFALTSGGATTTFGGIFRGSAIIR